MTIIATEPFLFSDMPTSSLALANAGRRVDPRIASRPSASTRASNQAWVDGFRSLCDVIRTLPAGWAGPNSVPVAERNFYLVEQYLGLALARVENPRLPSVVPAADGGLQIEWNRENVELEVLFGANGRVTALVEDHELGVEIEGEGLAAVDLLLRWAPRAAASSHDGDNETDQTQQATFVLAA